MPAKYKAAHKPIPIDQWSAGVRVNDNSEERTAGQADPRDLQEPNRVKCQILIVDPDADNRAQISGILSDLNHELIEADCTENAFLALAHHSIDLIIIDLDTPDMGGIAFCAAIRKVRSTHLIPLFIQASSAEPNEPESYQSQEVRAITAGADEFLLPPLRPAALRARVHATLRHKSMLESLDDSEAILFSLAKSVEDRDPDLSQHCQRLAMMAAGIGIALGLPAADVRSLQCGGYLHDVGKIAIPDRVLFKAGPLTPDEWQIMKSHAERGERMCACTKSLASVLPIIRHHHEKFDGSGYPDGLKGEQIPLLARILQVADIYDALTTERPYKRAYTSEEALEIMRQETEKGWRDPYLVEVFADLLPVFRHPAAMDPTRTSLQALAVSLEQYRRTEPTLKPV
jgi:putative two-component system response regulator